MRGARSRDRRRPCLAGAGALVLVCAWVASSFAGERAWEGDLDKALAAAKAQGRSVLVALYVPYVNTDVEDQDPALDQDAVAGELAGLVLAEANLLAHPEWRPSPVWSMPQYLFLDPDGSIVHVHDDGIAPAAFEAFRASAAERKRLLAQASAKDATSESAEALAHWHAERMNHAHAATWLRRAAERAKDPPTALRLLLELTDACSNQMMGARDEETARWALARMAQLDPEDRHGYAARRAVRSIEVTLEARRFAEGAGEAEAFLAATPQAEAAGKILQRLVWARAHMGDYAGALKALTDREGVRVEEEAAKALDAWTPHLRRLVALRAAADADPPGFEACVALLQAVHDDPPAGFWVRYLRRALGAPDIPQEAVAPLRVELAEALAADATTRPEALALLDQVLAPGQELPEGLREHARALRERWRK